MKKILILGATGFIGRNLVEYFSRNSTEYELFAIYNEKPSYNIPNVKWLKVDLTIKDQLFDIFAGIDVVIQAAATTSGSKDIVEKPQVHVTDNVLMNTLILDAISNSNVKHFVFLSCTVMLQPQVAPQKEADFNLNNALHERYFGVGWTKVFIEKLCEFYSKISDIKFTVIRHSNVYGPHDKFDLDKGHVFGATVKKVMTAPDGGVIEIWGDGEESRDLLHVSDLNTFIDLAINKQSGRFEIYNCGGGFAIKVKDLVRKIIFFSGKKLTTCHNLAKPTIKTTLCLDCTKAYQDLGWKPAIDLDSGIKSTIDWFKNNQ